VTEELFGRTIQSWSPTDSQPSLGDARVGEIVAGRYRIVRRIGAGGMGSVYAAWQLGAEQPVALKFINPALVREPEMARRFTNEARTYARLQHPNAVALHDVGQDENGAPFICMELVQGEDLASILSRARRLTAAEAVEVALQVSDVLAHAHTLGIIHRDLKPENILVRPVARGVHVKVVDFGIARLLGDPGGATQQVMIGTPGYMSPEQIKSQPVDGRSDIYALGIVLFQLVAGRHPFADVVGFTEMMFAQVNTPTPALGGVVPELQLPPALDRIVQRATRKDPAERFQKMEEVVEALTALQRAGITAPAIPGVAAPRAPAPAPIPLVAPITEPATAPATAPASSPFEKTERVDVPESGLRSGRGGSRRWIAAGVVAGVLAIGGVLALGPSPGPVAVPPIEPGPGPVVAAPPGNPEATKPAGSTDTAREVQRVLARQTALDVVVKSRGELALGNLDGARQLLDGSKEVLESVAGDPQLQPQIDGLRTELSQVGDALARAQALAKRGDCTGAIRVYDELLKGHAGIKQARAARDQCKRMLPPRIAE
jgi:serine/threonine-protein kinase